MSSTGRNIMKVVIGSAVASAVASLIARKVNQEDLPEEERVPLTETVKTAPIRLRDRWDRARTAGEVAATTEEARLQAEFRAKVNDPEALTPPRPPSR